jgi:hypothetical protein
MGVSARTEEGIVRWEQRRLIENDSDLDTCHVKAPVSSLNFPPDGERHHSLMVLAAVAIP